MANQIPVQTARDPYVEEQAATRGQVLPPNSSTSPRIAEVKGYATRARETLRASGMIALLVMWWGLYPSYARFRHQNIKRFGRRQCEIREKFFHTRNIRKFVEADDPKRNAWKWWIAFLAFARWYQVKSELPELSPETIHRMMQGRGAGGASQ